MSTLKTNKLENVAGTAGYDVRASFSHRNKIINGGFDVSQRGDFTSPTALTGGSRDFHTDRWFDKVSGVTGTVTHKLGQLVDGYTVNTLRLDVTSSATGFIYSQQGIEDLRKLQGKTVTISAWIKSNNTDFGIAVYEGTTSSWTKLGGNSGLGAWERISFQYTVALDAGNDDLFVAITSFGNSAASTALTSGDYCEISNVQLEEGSVATPFEQRPIGYEELLCRRYYVRYESASGTYLCTGAIWNTTTAYFTMPLEIVMRATPSLSVSNGADFQILQGGAIRDTTAILIVGTARRNMVAFTATSASLTTGQGCLLRFDGGGTRFLELDAEL